MTNDDLNKYDWAEMSEEELIEAIREQNKADLRTATVRTAVPSAWVAVALWALGRAGIEISSEELPTLIAALAGVTTFVYRVARALESALADTRFAWVPRLLLGSKKKPSFYIED
jgi:hypothetical protein